MTENEFVRIEELLDQLTRNKDTEQLADELRFELSVVRKKLEKNDGRSARRIVADRGILNVNELFDEAIKDQEFVVFYQPKVNLKTYEPSGAEGLCRWIHDGEIVFPDNFIPQLENSGKIEELDFYMLDHVCRDLRKWLDEGRNVVQISVNFSRINIGRPGLLSRIISTIDTYKVPHSLIQIELTETSTEVGFDDLRDLLLGLRDAGISTAVDDFGTGYSSLRLISELPWNVLKIDKSLLHEAEREGSSEHLMLSHIISMVLDMGMECVVEGVETQSDVKLLKDNKCFVAQGYFFDKPISCTQFEKLLDGLATNKKKK